MEEIKQFTIKNSKGMEVDLLNIGAIIKSIKLRDKNGNIRDVVLGFDDNEDYRVNSCFFGAVVGPIANRTQKASFVLDGTQYNLPINEGENNLHTDFDKGFHKRIFDATLANDATSIKFKLRLDDMEDGFPGNREFSVEYTLDDANALCIYYRMTTDKNTVINPTNHTYFNIGSTNSILEQKLKLKCSKMTPVAKDLIPTGQIVSVKNTPFDFLEPATVASKLDKFTDDEQLDFAGGLDHNFVRDDGLGVFAPTAWLEDENTGIKLTMSTNLPGLQVYAGSNISSCVGKYGVKYQKNSGICLETQYFPNSVNDVSFDQPILEAGKTFFSKTEYKFEV